MPAAVIITSEFIVPAKTTAKSQGIPDYPFAIVPHPIGSLTDKGLKERASEALPQILEILNQK